MRQIWRPRRSRGTLIAGALALSSVAIPSAVLAAVVDGTPRADSLRGTPGADVISARGGNDRVVARAGDDAVSGGRGNDLILLGRGDDRISSSRGRDTVYGGPGADVVDGASYAALGSGRDSYGAESGTRGCLEVDLGPGADSTTGDGGGVFTGVFGCVLRGGPGSDRIAWHGTDDSDVPRGEHWSRLYGGPGPDVIWGGYNDDTIFGGAGADQIHADEVINPDRIFAGKGDDELFFDLEPDGGPVDCGPGTDVVHGVQLPRTLRGCEVVNPTE